MAARDPSSTGGGQRLLAQAPGSTGRTHEPADPVPALAADVSARSPLAGRTTRPRLDTLTALRGLAALVVFGFHASVVLVDPSAKLADLVNVPSKQCIGFFFALSGFVLTWSVRPGDRLLSFWRRRFARIYPVYIVVLLASAVGTVALNHSLPVGPFLASLLAVQAFVPDPAWYFALNPVGWTLSCEVFLYLALPFFIRPLARLGLRGRRTVQVALLSALVIIALIARDIHSVWLVGIFPLARLPEFALGCTLALDVAGGQVLGRRVGIGGALLLTVAAAVLTMVPVAQLHYLPFMTIPLLLLLSAGAFADLADRRSLLTRRPFVWFGEVSFCFYLVQLKVLVAIAMVVSAMDVSIDSLKPLWILAALAVSTGLAWMLHRYVEIPAERKLRGRSRRRPPVPLQG